MINNFQNNQSDRSTWTDLTVNFVSIFRSSSQRRRRTFFKHLWSFLRRFNKLDFENGKVWRSRGRRWSRKWWTVLRLQGEPQRSTGSRKVLQTYRMLLCWFKWQRTLRSRLFTDDIFDEIKVNKRRLLSKRVEFRFFLS